jgi:RND family efflux transporter MFP subunit
MKNPTTTFTIFIFVALLASCGKTEESKQIQTKGNAIPVKVIELNKGTFTSSVTASGNFTTKDETLLSFKIGGIVSKIYVEEGDQIRKGQLLASLDLTEIQTGLNQAKISLEKAERDYQRASRLYTDSVATLEQKQNAETALAIAKQQLKAVEFNVQYAEIRATQNGFVLRKSANPGQQVSSGTAILQTNGASDQDWVLQTTVNDRNWALISAGDSAVIFTDTNSGVQLPAKVINKSRSADPITGGFWVDISPLNTGEMTLASGMFGRAKIFPTKQASGWEIPYESLLDAQGDYGFVFVTKDQKLAIKQKVKLGKISTETVQILSGLEDSPFLIVSGSAYLADQSPILIIN